MSLGSEFESDAAADFAILEGKIEDAARKGIWKTKDGREIPVTEMTDQHLANTIRMLGKNDECDLYYPLIHRMERELERRRT